MRRRIIISCILFIGCVLVCVAYFSAKSGSDPVYEGRPLKYWARELESNLSQGKHQVALDVMEKMDEKAVPFWLNRMKKPDATAYPKVWPYLPQPVRGMLPLPHRRNLAYFALSKLHFTNAIPELIELSYSTDPELQSYSVNLLYTYSRHFYDPSSECIAAFCDALKTGDAQTRQSAVDGLGIIPLRPEALPTLHFALDDPDEEIRVNAAAIIVELQPDQDLTRFFEAGLKSTNQNVRVISQVALQPKPAPRSSVP